MMNNYSSASTGNLNLGDTGISTGKSKKLSKGQQTMIINQINMLENNVMTIMQNIINLRRILNETCDEDVSKHIKKLAIKINNKPPPLEEMNIKYEEASPTNFPQYPETFAPQPPAGS